MGHNYVNSNFGKIKNSHRMKGINITFETNNGKELFDFYRGMRKISDTYIFQKTQNFDKINFIIIH